MHYAFVKRGKSAADFLRDRFQICVIEYEIHDEVELLIERMHNYLKGLQGRAVEWAFSLRSPEKIPDGKPATDLRIVRGCIPIPVDDGKLLFQKHECAAFSAWRAKKAVKLRESAAEKLGRVIGKGRVGPEDFNMKDDGYVWQLRGQPIFAVAAREQSEGKFYRDTRVIGPATAAFLKVAQAEGFTTAHVELLATGQHREWPEYVSLFESVRAYAQWRRQLGENEAIVRLAIYVRERSLLHLLGAGRLSIPELLNTSDLRFWLEISRPNGDLQRYLVFSSPDKHVRDLLSEYDVPKHWSVQVIPNPGKYKVALVFDGLMNQQDLETLSQIGVLPGSTLSVGST